MSAKNLTEEEFEKLVTRLIDADGMVCDNDAPIDSCTAWHVNSPGHIEHVECVLEDFFNVQRKYTVIVKITKECTYQTTAFSEYEAQEKVYNRSSDQDKESGVYLMHTDDPEEEHIDTVRGGV